ncbi:sugar transferase [Streptomyces purpureus]|uniref:sugar transferase n=1 Tax=Streptomyces purpureus TaxID=1951 RepID=UPI00037A2E03|nr:sugar transferase [Streptomyces purpureus]
MTAKRALDLLGSLFLLLVLASAFLAVAAALALSALGALDHPDGVLRRDVRAGLHGREFRMLTFRTGSRLLARLPQLINVVRGEMSLVGPCPLTADDEGCAGQARRRLSVRPGMTGLWQVSGRSELPWEEMTLLDLHYVDHHWLGMDLAILSRTLPAWARASARPI